MAASKWWNYMVFMALVGLAICSANRLPVRGTRAENGDDLDEHKAARALGGMGGGFGGLGRWGYNHRGHYYPGFGGGGGGGGPWYGGRGYDYGGGVPYRCVPPSTCPICHDFVVYVNHDNHPPQASAGSKGESGQFNKKATIDQSSAAQATESN